MNDLDNVILKKVMCEIYNNRPPLPVSQRVSIRREVVNHAAFCEVWFMTRGCFHDAHGGCSMCNYGKGHSVAWDEIRRDLEQEMSGLPESMEELIVSPSGSMFDDREVPPEMREQIFHMVSCLGAKKFICESRADTISAEKLRRMKELVGHGEIYIEIGLETGYDWVLKHCVNKHMTRGLFLKALDIAHQEGIRVIGNIGLGIPFLSERANIHYAVSSIRGMLDAGVDCIVVFPYHVKPGTLLEVLYKQGMYLPVSLWALAEVLGQFDENETGRIQISWYRNYYTDKKKVIVSPGTCDECYAAVLGVLDRYKDIPDIEIIRTLQNMDCACHEKWKEQMCLESEQVDFPFVEECYRMLGRQFHLPEQELEIQLEQMRKELGDGLCW